MIEHLQLLRQQAALLFEPGNATDFFADRERVPLPSSLSSDWSAPLAWWLSEAARLMYRGRVENPSRHQFWHQIGWHRVESVYDADSETLAEIVDLPNGARLVLFRGSCEWANWKSNLRWHPRLQADGSRVHGGFLAALDSVWPQLRPWLEPQDRPLLLAGHSLGGALAQLAQDRLPPMPQKLVMAYTFGAPCVGDGDYVEQRSGRILFRIVNRWDMVPLLPFSVGSIEYCHAGRLFYLDTHRHLQRDYSDDRFRVEQRRRWRSVQRMVTSLENWDPARVRINARLADHAPALYSQGLLQQIS